MLLLAVLLLLGGALSALAYYIHGSQAFLAGTYVLWLAGSALAWYYVGGSWLGES